MRRARKSLRDTLVRTFSRSSETAAERGERSAHGERDGRRRGLNGKKTRDEPQAKPKSRGWRHYAADAVRRSFSVSSFGASESASNGGREVRLPDVLT